MQFKQAGPSKWILVSKYRNLWPGMPRDRPLFWTHLAETSCGCTYRPCRATSPPRAPISHLPVGWCTIADTAVLVFVLVLVSVLGMFVQWWKTRILLGADSKQKQWPSASKGAEGKERSLESPESRKSAKRQ